MNMRKYRAILLFLLVFASIFINQITVHAQSSYTKKVEKKNENFMMEAEYGIDGIAFYDMPTMISVTIESKENFTGVLRVVPGAYYGSTSVAYGEDISVAAGEKKTFQFVPTAIGNNGVVTIQILNDKDKVVYQEKHTISLENAGSKVTIGILSDDYSALSYFDGNTIMIDNSQAVSSIIELTANDFPKDDKALSVLQYLIVDNFDTASLSTEQYDALKSWVQSGGVLILGLGSNYQSVLNCFDDSFISGTFGSLKKQNVKWDISVGASSPDTYYDINNIDVTVNKDVVADLQQESTTEETDSNTEEIDSNVSLTMDCLEFELEGGETFSQFTTESSASMKSIGMGRVIVLGYSLAMEPMSSADFNKSVAKFLIEHAQTDATVSKFYGNDTERSSMYAGVETAKLSDLSSKPSVILYGLILIAYVVLVGPILYVILKKMNKREKIWVAVPIVTLAFTAIIYLSGFMYRMNKPLVSTFTLIELNRNTQSEKIYTNIICPKPKEYNIQFADGYTGFRNNIDNYTYSMFDTGNDELAIDYMIKENSKGTKLYINTTEPFEENSFLINKNSENNIGSIDYDLTCSTTGFEGTVTNHTCYDLEDLVVTFEGYLCLVGDVKKGETVIVDSSKIVVMNAYGTFENLYPGRQIYLDREKYLHYQINNMIEQNMIDKQAYGRGYIWAGITSYKPELIEESDVKRAGSGVILTSYTASYSDISGEFYPTIDGFVIAQQGDFNLDDRYLYGAEAVVTYSFETMASVTELRRLEEQLTHGTLADVYAYNVDTGEYEQIFVGTDTLSGAELKKYMLDDVIVLKYVQKDMNYGTYIPKISAKGE